MVVGLGNPGAKYRQTRHNIGFWVIDQIAEENAVNVKKRFCDAMVGEWFSNGDRVLLVKPQTYMNRSGECVKDLLQEFGASADDLIVVYDDIDLPFGRIRIRPSGGAGGHRGVLSILERLEGEAFCRVRVGIGRPPEGVDPAEFVLEPFGSEECEALGEVIARASAAVMTLLQDGIQAAMEQFNRPS
jgi:PTH1 family peptidyl-tRNA hydrolase